MNILALASVRMRAWSEPSVTSRVSNHSAFVDRTCPWQGNAGELGRIGYTDYVTAGVSVYVGVDADEGKLAQLDTCLFAYFAAAGFLHCFADFDNLPGAHGSRHKENACLSLIHI